MNTTTLPDPVGLPFDQYGRYRMIREIVDALRPTLGERLRILDVGGYFRSARGDDVLPATLFLPDDHVLVLDTVACEHPAYTRGDGRSLHFMADTFDVVISCDTLEHVPAADRPAFWDELLRVARHAVILAAPFASPEVVAAEKLVADFITAELHVTQPQLAEHVTYGLPDGASTAALLGERGLAYRRYPTGYVHAWLTMMLFKHYVAGRTADVAVHEQIDTYYTRFFADHERREPAYRQVWVVAASGTGAWLPTIDATITPTIQSPTAPLPAEWAAIERWLRSLVPFHAATQQRHAAAPAAPAAPALVAPACVAPPAATPTTGRRVLFVCTDVVATNMAGPGIRAWELAHVLAEQHRVTLALPNPPERPSDRMAQVCYHEVMMATLLADADVVIGQGFVFAHYPELLTHDLPLAIDLYDPLILESLDLYSQHDLAAATDRHRHYQHLTDAQLQRGDFFFCATERQRDYWLGALTAAGRVNPAVVRQHDRDLTRLIDLVPSGVAAPPTPAATPVLRGVHPAIPTDALLAVWAGGLWDWFDPFVVLEAVAKLRDECPRLRVCFFAGARPNPDGDPVAMPLAAAVRERAAQLGLLLGLSDDRVIVLDEWIAYNERGAYLREADIGISAHQPGVETRMAFRTRLLDYLWAELPMICSTGDSLSAQVVHAGAGIGVAPGDTAGWITALRTMYSDTAQRQRHQHAAAALATTLRWQQVAQPLVAFCALPQRAADTPVKSGIVAAQQEGELPTMSEPTTTTGTADTATTVPQQPPRVLIISHDRIGSRMAGPGIRYWELAHTLAAQQPVTLIAPAPCDLPATSVALGRYEWGNAASLADWLSAADVIVANGHVLQAHPDIATSVPPLVVDMYDPTLLENLELYRAAPATERQQHLAADRALLNQQLTAGDFFVCATERQRDMYIGGLLAAGRIVPATSDDDPDLRRLIDVVSSGLPATPPTATPLLRAAFAAIHADDPLILWGGGLWDWMDPLTLIDAMPAIVAQHPTARLVFLAGVHPSHNAPTAMNNRARERATASGLRDTHIFFYDEWVPYDDRGGVLLEATLAVSLHRDNLETRYAAIRSRMLDHLWAGLPAVISSGDPAAALFAPAGAAVVVPIGDAKAVAIAVNRLLHDDTARATMAQHARALASRYTWERVAQPLLAYCAAPYQTRPRNAPPAVTHPDRQPDAAQAEPVRDAYATLEATRNAAVAVQEQTWQIHAPDGVAGRLAQARRPLIEQVVRPYVEPLREQQQRYNAALLRSVYAINQVADHQRNEILSFNHAAHVAVQHAHRRIDDETQRIDTRIDDETQRIDIRTSDIEQRLDALEHENRVLHGYLEQVTARLVALEQRADSVERNERLVHYSLSEIVAQLAGLEEADTQLVLALRRTLADRAATPDNAYGHAHNGGGLPTNEQQTTL